jgi:hypothetical protein
MTYRPPRVLPRRSFVFASGDAFGPQMAFGLVCVFPSGNGSSALDLMQVFNLIGSGGGGSAGMVTPAC